MKLKELNGKEATEQINMIKENPRLLLEDIEDPTKFNGKTIVFLTEGIQLRGVQTVIQVFEYYEGDGWFKYDKDLSNGSKTYSGCYSKIEDLIECFQLFLKRSYLGYLLS